MKILAYTIADEANKPILEKFVKSLRHFHSEQELPLYVVEGEELARYLKDDPNFFYRAAPILAKRFREDYDLVIKMDCDQLVLGKLNYIWEQQYDVGVVYNGNRIDPKMYQTVGGWGIQPEEYYNAGLVAMRSKDFINRWHDLCYSKHFERFQFREQDILNLLCYYGDYDVLCFDDPNPTINYVAFHGLRAKGEGLHYIVRKGNLVLPKGQYNYPAQDTVIKLYHWAGGGNERKMHYRVNFSDAAQKYIEEVLE